MSQGIHHGIRSLSSGSAGASRAIVALGSNLGNRANYLRRALDQMGKWSRVHRTSFLYESAPYVILFSEGFPTCTTNIQDY